MSAHVVGVAQSEPRRAPIISRNALSVGLIEVQIRLTYLGALPHAGCLRDTTPHCSSFCAAGTTPKRVCCNWGAPCLRRHRARHTIEDFCLSYLPYHGLDLRAFLRWWDVLVFVEGVIYELDEQNEVLARQGIVDQPAAHLLTYQHLQTVLQEEGLWTKPVQTEMEAGLEYWRQERLLAHAMLQHPVIPAGGHAIFSLDEVHAAAAGKSFDYRVLNLVVYALRGVEPPATLLEFLRVDERLVDTGDDLVDYEDDVDKGAFNVFRCYVHLFGREAQLKLATSISLLEAQHARLLALLPHEWQEHHTTRQKDAAESEAALRWVIPSPVILDEAAFRADHCSG